METANMPDRAYVVPDGSKFDVVPPVVFLRTGDPFQVRNLTQWTVHVSFPAGLMDPGEGDVAPDAEPHTFTVIGARPGVFSYHVRVVIIQEDHASGIKGFSLDAVGNSDPRIIID